MSGPFASLTVVEVPGCGTVPLAGQHLADMGAGVIAIDHAPGRSDPTDNNRIGKRSMRCT
jgi:alpha-methylacyl-CoA racemase